MHIAMMAALLLTATMQAAEPEPDPFLGRWVLDAKASKYADHRCPRRMVIDMTTGPRGIHYHSETEPAVGETFHVDYTANYDGKPVVVTGDRGILLPVAIHRDAPNHVKAVYTSAMQVMATSERTVSGDGRTMTITTTSHDQFGQRQTNIGVYRRADARTLDDKHDMAGR